MKTLLTINAAAVAATYVCQEHNIVRKYINGIHFEPVKKGVLSGGAVAVSTDGHRLLEVTDPNGFCEAPITVSFSPLTIQKARLKTATTIDLIESDLGIIAKVNTKVGAVLSEAALVDNPEKFPDWRRVIPDKLPDKRCGAVSVNSRYLSDFGTAQRYMALGTNYQTIGIVTNKTDQDALAFVFRGLKDGLKARGLIMPLECGPLTTW